MTTRISLTAAVAVAALIVVSAAFGGGPLNGSSDGPTAAVSPDWFERAAAAAERKHLQNVQLASAQNPDWFERAAGAAIHNSPAPVVDDRFRIGPTDVGAAVSATSSGRGIEWPQIGIGFGIGLLLALSLYLAVRFTRIRPLTH